MNVLNIYKSVVSPCISVAVVETLQEGTIKRYSDNAKINKLHGKYVSDHIFTNEYVPISKTHIFLSQNYLGTSTYHAHAINLRILY